MQHFNQLELARRWGVSPRTLERWRNKGYGPRFYKIGARCIYPLDEVECFEKSQLRQQSDQAKRLGARP